MTRRPHHTRSNHSLAGSVSVGLAILAIAFLFWMSWIHPALSQVGPCGPWKELRAKLGRDFRETPVAGGLINQQLVLFVLASPDGKTFSIVTVTSNGLACILATGTNWEPEKDRGI